MTRRILIFCAPALAGVFFGVTWSNADSSSRDSARRHGVLHARLLAKRYSGGWGGDRSRRFSERQSDSRQYRLHTLRPTRRGPGSKTRAGGVYIEFRSASGAPERASGRGSLDRPHRGPARRARRFCFRRRPGFRAERRRPVIRGAEPALPEQRKGASGRDRRYRRCEPASRHLAEQRQRRPWVANAPNGAAGIGNVTVLDPQGYPLAGAPNIVAGGVFAGNLTNRTSGSGGMLTAAVGTAIVTKSPDLTGRAVFATVHADGSVAQVNVLKGVDPLAPPATVTPLARVDRDTAESADPRVIAREGLVFNWVHPPTSSSPIPRQTAWWCSTSPTMEPYSPPGAVRSARSIRRPYRPRPNYARGLARELRQQYDNWRRLRPVCSEPRDQFHRAHRDQLRPRSLSALLHHGDGGRRDQARLQPWRGVF